MNFYEIGKKDGAAQFAMDKLTETSREGEMLAYTAMGSLMKFEQLPDRIDQVHYACGFVEGYLTAQFTK